MERKTLLCMLGVLLLLILIGVYFLPYGEDLEKDKNCLQKPNAVCIN